MNKAVQVHNCPRARKYQMPSCRVSIAHPIAK
ncbi:hypothetical protein CPAR01_06687 [Colletotrichum paranaense]|uniref:Uncharacterized protein n=3 Tax=Colletotrichum acutatum species complex TaxID=2707335 RepID=A0AAI9V1N6_9PEZI|nr:uncharacterized protein CPAR01_06687 [Colletotrichum paranaense]KAK1468610.1 hypothetical protein CMEL01_00377 [Colletotrichum melonis]KAK1479930.1 hypothetical protein CCUS01_00484 [Colletotrichum cuscutae]KAK1540698.1 hypothetical protein CPAR01_06687 [Colletotrichum paranaense]